MDVNLISLMKKLQCSLIKDLFLMTHSQLNSRYFELLDQHHFCSEMLFSLGMLMKERFHVPLKVTIQSRVNDTLTVQYVFHSFFFIHLSLLLLLFQVFFEKKQHNTTQHNKLFLLPRTSLLIKLRSLSLVLESPRHRNHAKIPPITCSITHTHTHT